MLSMCTNVVQSMCFLQIKTSYFSSGPWFCGQTCQPSSSPEFLEQSNGHLGGMPVQTPGQRVILKKWAWLIAQRLDPQDLTSCSPVACKYRTLGRCEGLFLSDMAAAAAAYTHQSIALTSVHTLHFTPQPQLTSFSVIRDEFILSLA